MPSQDYTGLKHIQQLLQGIGLLVGALSATGSASATPLAAARAEMIACIASIGQVEGTTTRASQSQYVVRRMDPGVVGFDVRHAHVPNNGWVDVFVDIRSSGQPGALFLSMGGNALNLGSVTSTLTLEIGGALGARVLTFTSGATLSDVTMALNSYQFVTGVRAHLDGTGIRLNSAELGSNSFVSVRVLNDGTIQGDNAGVYHMMPQAAHRPDPSSWIPFYLTPFVLDTGRDIVAIVNGEALIGDRNRLRIQRPHLKADMWLDETRTGTLGEFWALNIRRRP
jgi:hypothetical protein